MDPQVFRTLLDETGAGAALADLNSSVPHRDTGLYRLDQGVMTNVLLIDKKNEVTPDFLVSVPFQDSFCQFVLKLGRYSTGNSTDERFLDGHKYQGVMVSYTGVPVPTDQGFWGTLCHFDTEPWTIADEAFDSLRSAARIIATRPPVTFP